MTDSLTGLLAPEERFAFLSLEMARVSGVWWGEVDCESLKTQSVYIYLYLVRWGLLPTIILRCVSMVLKSWLSSNKEREPALCWFGVFGNFGGHVWHTRKSSVYCHIAICCLIPLPPLFALSPFDSRGCLLPEVTREAWERVEDGKDEEDGKD